MASAARASATSRAEVDCAARRWEFVGILERFRSADGDNYDCNVPSSGGKSNTAAFRDSLTKVLHA